VVDESAGAADAHPWARSSNGQGPWPVLGLRPIRPRQPPDPLNLALQVMEPQGRCSRCGPILIRFKVIVISRACIPSRIPLQWVSRDILLVEPTNRPRHDGAWIAASIGMSL